MAARRLDSEGTTGRVAPRDLSVAAFWFEAGAYMVFSFSVRRRAARVRLTATEREVVWALVGGRSNAEIARARGRSVRTVANQVASVFRKLGVGSRAELAARWAQDALATRDP